MTLLSLGAGGGVIVLVLIRIVLTITNTKRCRAKAAQQGCEPVPLARNMGFLGLSRIMKYMKAVQEDRAPQQYVELLNDLDSRRTLHTARMRGNLHWRVDRDGS